jgi:hypothetical protein
VCAILARDARKAKSYQLRNWLSGNPILMTAPDARDECHRSRYPRACNVFHRGQTGARPQRCETACMSREGCCLKIAPFRIEQYFAVHEFTAPHLLSSSDAESVWRGALSEKHGCERSFSGAKKHLYTKLRCVNMSPPSENPCFIGVFVESPQASQAECRGFESLCPL